MNLSMLLEMAAENASDRVAVGPRDGGITYGQLLDRARTLATELTASDHAHVALLDLNGPVVPVLLFGAAAAGVPLAPLNYRLPDDQLDQAVARLAPATVVVGEDAAGRLTARDDVVFRRTEDILQAASMGTAHPDLPFVDPDDPAVLLFTSGTTGAPKAAVLRHRHMTNYIVGTVEFADADEDEAILISVPNYHIAGISSVLSSVYAGRRMVQLQSFSPEGWVELVAVERVTQAMVVPTMLGRILDVLEATGTRLPTLRTLSYGGGRMPQPTVEKAMKLLPHVDFVNAYGLTETSSTIAVLGPEDHRAALSSNLPQIRARLGSVGRPLPSVEVEIRDHTGTPVPAGEYGEVVVRGEQVAGEYTSHSALDADGWYPTRDRGRLDSDGYLFLDGRADDVIVRGGENISPGEIEDVLTTHPTVAEAAVVGVADPEWGERVEAVVVAASDTGILESDLQQWVRERLRSTRVPAQIHQWTELPFNETGKLLRRALRDELHARAQLREANR
ncbi:class I adenylate-forming enzyme family protein [Rhodococcus sp. ACPA1]|uniref:class I adenylate-forming enzyme family protein n=1 Tax=Rhodococcus sp. ACPA1 TaxID=2028572 RepID=UPI000BB11C1F|nr:class I adenylate-forming enzyme family protein [Rhodococcus sp. ACPA1]PBC47559.1 AMP-dependent synthetase [Rhodococcus sp. ACPA1]